jgi:carboxyl-terminal processing protease
MQGAIRGMLAALGDPHSNYMTPDEYKIATTDLSGELEGIGAYVEGAGDYLRIVSPFPGSPAEKAGLKPRDLIVKVDGEDVGGLGESQIISRVRGPAGSTVHLSIQREGSAGLLEFDVTRAKITIPSVESKMLDGQIAYVKINDFGEKTPGELTTTLKSVMAQKPVGLVLDLRGNPGGYVDTAIAVASQFISKGVLMRERFNDGTENTLEANPGGLATDIPMAVLVNKGSASASEIVAGAIQDYGRGKVVGETSYGKGSEQRLSPLQNNSGVVRITVARWLTPKGRTIQKIGITPDVPVTLTDADAAAQRDPQLDAAVNLLQK